MPRQPRALSENGFYHVIIRGSGKQLLFEDNDDYLTYLSYLDAIAPRHEMRLLAWCLMSNHVHLLLDDACNTLSLFVHDLSTAYAVYFNTKYGRTGPVFDGRFRSVPVESDRQLLSAVRYIHANPVKAGIATLDGYTWSSYTDYLSESPVRTSTEMVLELTGGAEGFRKLSFDCDCSSYHFRDAVRPSDTEAVSLARDVMGGQDPKSVRSLEKTARNRALRQLRGTGLTIKQVARLTGVSESTVSRYTRR